MRGPFSLQPRAAPRTRPAAGRQWNLALKRKHRRPMLADDPEGLPIDQAGHDPPVVGARIEEDVDLDGPCETVHPPQQLVAGPQLARLLGFRRDRHQIGETRGAVRGPERRFEYGRLARVPARRRERPDRGDCKAAAAAAIQ